ARRRQGVRRTLPRLRESPYSGVVAPAASSRRIAIPRRVVVRRRTSRRVAVVAGRLGESPSSADVSESRGGAVRARDPARPPRTGAGPGRSLAVRTLVVVRALAVVGPCAGTTQTEHGGPVQVFLHGNLLSGGGWRVAGLPGGSPAGWQPRRVAGLPGGYALPVYVAHTVASTGFGAPAAASHASTLHTCPAAGWPIA